MVFFRRYRSNTEWVEVFCGGDKEAANAGRPGEETGEWKMWWKKGMKKKKSDNCNCLYYIASSL